MRNRIVLSGGALAAVLLQIAFLGGCASQATFKNAKVTMDLDRFQLRELNEAFKSAEDKVVTVPNVGEVECPERRCLLPVKGKADRMVEGASPVATDVKGTLVLWGDVTGRLLKMLDAAQYTAKDQKVQGFGGEVSCTKAKCTFTFALDDTALSADGRGLIEDAPRMPASVEEQ